MDSAKIAKTIFNIAYFVGVLIALYFIIIYFFGSNEAMNPEAMLPFTWKDQAFFYLAIGSVPMLCACMAVYIKNAISF